jgi:hypothetical protein
MAQMRQNQLRLSGTLRQTVDGLVEGAVSKEGAPKMRML